MSCESRSRSNKYESVTARLQFTSPDPVGCRWTLRSRVGWVPRTLRALVIECDDRPDPGEPSSPDPGDSPAGNALVDSLVEAASIRTVLAPTKSCTESARFVCSCGVRRPTCAFWEGVAGSCAPCARGLR
jgi:hypothetical protein